MSFLFQKIIMPQIYREIVQILQETGVQSVVDAGCGNGHFSEYLAQSNFEVIGIDKEWSKIEHCYRQTRLTFRNLPQFINVDFTRISLDKQFDAIAFLFVIHELAPADRTAIFQRIPSLLATNGIIILLDYQKPTSNSNKITSLLWRLIQADEKATQSGGTKIHYNNFVENIAQPFERWIADLPATTEILQDKLFFHSTIRLLALRATHIFEERFDI